MKKNIRKMIRNIILEEIQVGMNQNLGTSYNKDLTFIEKLKFLLGVYTNLMEFLDDVDAVIKVVKAAMKDKGESPEGRPIELIKISNDLILFKNELDQTKMNLETDENMTGLIDLYIQAINGNVPSADLKRAEKNLDKQGFANDVYNIIDIVHYLFELNVLTGYELSIEEYIKLGEKAAREGYTSSSYPGNESFDF